MRKNDFRERMIDQLAMLNHHALNTEGCVRRLAKAQENKETEERNEKLREEKRRAIRERKEAESQTARQTASKVNEADKHFKAFLDLGVQMVALLEDERVATEQARLKAKLDNPVVELYGVVIYLKKDGDKVPLGDPKLQVVAATGSDHAQRIAALQYSPTDSYQAKDIEILAFPLREGLKSCVEVLGSHCTIKDTQFIGG